MPPRGDTGMIAFGGSVAGIRIEVPGGVRWSQRIGQVASLPNGLAEEDTRIEVLTWPPVFSHIIS